MTRHACIVPSPVGPLTLIAQDDALVAVHWPGDPVEMPATTPHHPLLQTAATQLAEYFAGMRYTFTLPLRFAAGTPFQQRVWNLLRQISYGQTWSYGQLARHLGQPTACRAVGAANGQNPLPIFVPCHRVIGADGSLTGFGGGLEAKKTLLALERRPRLHRACVAGCEAAAPIVA